MGNLKKAEQKICKVVRSEIMMNFHDVGMKKEKF